MTQVLQPDQNLVSVILEEVTIEGEGIAGDTLVFGGELVGDLNVGRLVISNDGRVLGNINAKFLKIAGRFDGTALAEELYLTQTARVTGRFVAQVLSIEPGAEIIGEISAKNDSYRRSKSIIDLTLPHASNSV
jgi:cytoskeletal protein CcmA (bactofilin family)